MSRQKSSKKRDDILIAASDLFLEHGFNDVSMDMIRTNANVSKNTLYSHFEDKSALFKVVIISHWENEKTPKVIAKETKIDTLKAFAKALIKYLYTKKTQAFFRILVAEAGRFPDLAQGIISNNQPPILLNFSKFLQSEYKLEQDKGERAAAYFFGLLKEDAFWHVLAGFRKPYTNAEIVAHVDNVVAIFVPIIKKI